MSRSDSQSRSLWTIASDLLSKAFAAEPEPEPEPEVTWAVQPMGTKVDIEDKDALWVALDHS